MFVIDSWGGACESSPFLGPQDTDCLLTSHQRHTNYLPGEWKALPGGILWTDTSPLAGVLNQIQQDTVAKAISFFSYIIPLLIFSSPVGEISARFQNFSAHFQGNKYRLMY